MSLRLDAQTTFRLLLGLIFLLTYANCLEHLGRVSLNIDDIHFFNLNAEGNIPTLYSTLLYLLATALLSIIAIMHKKADERFLGWLGLALICAALALDETAQVHERLTHPMRRLFNTSGYLYFAWVIPYGIAGSILLILYYRFITALPWTHLRLFILAAVVFLSGAVGLELISGRHVELYGKYSFGNFAYSTLEEFLEMLGIAIFIYSLLRYLSERDAIVSISFRKTENLL